MTNKTDDQGESIENIESFSRLKEEMNSVSDFEALFPVLKPVLKQLGSDTDSIERKFEEENMDEMRDLVEDLVTLPDRFNEQFASRGWICYDMMNIQIAQNAVQKAEREDPETAEEILVEYYNKGTVKNHLNWMKQADAFSPRIELAEKALIDYAEGRYHACIPVVLSIMDGLVTDAHWEARDQPTGMFFGDPDLRAWDSMTAHINGLERLKPVLNETRVDLETEDIDKPFRHGIVHGRDLGYANKTVAAKTWAALFAVREWVIKAENEELVEPEKEEESLLKKLRDLSTTNTRLENWEPREVSVGDEIPQDGSSKDYQEGTPEHTLVEFLELWMDHNWGYMINFLKESGGETPDVELIKSQFSSNSLQSFSIISIDDKPAACDIKIHIAYDIFGERQEGKAKVRLVRSDKENNIVIRGYGEANWYIYNWMLLLSPE